ncbi:MAG: hypothetical protein KF812_12010 [Fimbriimonadaceae bacterium]|nr:hypothetical protein [Fimbriimonadaceae bacterium]
MTLFVMALLTHAFTQDESDRLGLTNPQIVALGYEAWSAKYSEERGDSTASINIGNTVFRDALLEEDDKIIARWPESRRSFILNLRRDLNVTTRDVVEVGYVVTGGGTIWSNIETGRLVHNEQTISKVLNQRFNSRTTQDEVWTAYQQMNLKFERSVTDMGRYAPVPVEDVEASRRRMLACRERFFGGLSALARQPIGVRREVFAAYVENFRLISRMGD